MKKLIVCVLVVLLSLSNTKVTKGADEIKVLIDESRVYAFSEGEQKEMIEDWGWPEDADWSYSFENYDEYWGLGTALEKIQEVASVDIRKSGKLSYSTLRDYDVLILASFMESYSSAEVDAIKKFVENGGGLLLLADQDSANNSVSRKFDVLFYSETVVIGDENTEIDERVRFTIEERGIILILPKIYYFDVDTLTEHPVFEGIEKLTLYFGMPIDSYKSGTVLARTHGDTWADMREFGEGVGLKERNEDTGPFDILLAMEMGRGRALFSGSSVSFWNVIVGREEHNLDFLANAVEWLGEPGGPYKQWETANELAQEKLSDAVSLYESYKFSEAKTAFENAIGEFEESREIYPNAEANRGVDEAEEYIELCETGIEADNIFGNAGDLFDKREYKKATEEYEKAQGLYSEIEYTEMVEECTEKVDESNQWISLREEAASLYEQAEEALNEAPNKYDPAGYQDAKSLFEKAKSKWVEYDDPAQVEACEEKIKACNEEIAVIEKNRTMAMVAVIVVIVIIAVVVVVVIVVLRRRKPKPVTAPPEGEEVPLEPDALATLKKRYAKGEITKEEYEKLKSVLEE